MFIPLNAGKRVYTNFPAGTLFIIVLNLLVFGWEMALWFGPDIEALQNAVYAWGFTPAPLLAHQGARGLTAFTSMYLHGGLGHIFFNLLFLWVFGPAVEDLTGSLSFLLFYTLSGLAGNLLTLILDPRSPIPGIGASGAIAGVMGAFLFLYPGQRIRTFIFILIPLFPRLPAWLLLTLWLAQQVFYGQMILEAGVNFTGIGVWAHVGGFLGGLMFVYLCLRKEVMFARESVVQLNRSR